MKKYTPITTLLILISSFTGSLSAPTHTYAFERIPNETIEAKAYIVLDTLTNKVIWAHNSSAQLAIASITKIASALSVLELFDKNTSIKFDGATWKMNELLKFMLITSSNEAAQELVSFASSTNSRLDLVANMNNLAERLALHQTFFLNSSGLDITERISGGYASARNIAYLMKTFIDKQPELAAATTLISGQVHPNTSQMIEVNNTNKMLTSLTGIKASKTGLTDLAGGNLVVAFDVAINRPMIAVVLGSTEEGRFNDMKILINATMRYVNRRK